jgi:hypothetical protein
VSDNDAGANGTGGLRAGVISLKFSTVAHNRGRDLDGLTSLTAFASVVGGGDPDQLGHQCAPGQVTASQGYNVSDDAGCGFGGGTGDQSPVADLGLLHLGDNGAPGLSRHPAFGGILIDAVPPGGNCGVTVTSDQRSLPRPLPLGGVANCDIGAVEFDRNQLPAHPFTDVAAWIDDAVDWIWFYGHASGYDDDTYRPANPLTRAQYVRMLYRLAGSPDVAGYPAHGLGDVPLWVADAVTWAAHDPDGGGPLEAPMVGFPDDTFRPNDEVTRAQAVRALYRLTGSPSVAGFPPHGFSDVPAWVQDAVTWAADDPDDGGPLDKIIEGFPGGTFRPDDVMNRGQSTRMLFRWDAAFN